jgi:hypothetical protein
MYVSPRRKPAGRLVEGAFTVCTLTACRVRGACGIWAVGVRRFVPPDITGVRRFYARAGLWPGPYDGDVDHVVPPDEQGCADGLGAPLSARRTLFFAGGSPEEAAYLAALGARVDDDFVGRQRRFREFHGRSRPFTDGERAALREVMAPVVRDMVTSGAVLPVIQDEGYPEDDETFCVWLWGYDGTGMGVWIYVARRGAGQVARVAEQVQEWEIEELAAVGRSATWPECPDHPDSHPLDAVVDGGNAVWRCSRSGRVISAIGALG